MFKLNARSVVAALSISLLAIAASSANADEADKAHAVQLFLDAKTLMDNGQYAQACPKLEESLRLEPADGTLLRLAWCDEMIGRTATAWALFKQGLANAQKVGNPERAKFANDHLAAIEPKLSKVTIHIPASAQIDGLEVRWDGKIIGKAAWDSEFPVDPGNHALSATAPGKQLWTTTVGVAPNADRRTVEIPQLDAAPVKKDATIEPAPHTPTIVYVLGGTGMVFLGGAIGMHLAAVADQEKHRTFCQNQIAFGGCTGDEDTVSSGKRWETLSIIAGGLGIASIATAVTFYITSRSTPAAPSVGLSATTFAGGPGLRLEGSF
jgi:hypothetical protein